MKKVLKFLSIVMLTIVLILIGLLVWLSVTDFRPGDIEQISINNSSNIVETTTEFTILNWNIGYGSLGEDSDFFFDGGNMIITPIEDYTKYFNGIKKFIKSNAADIFYLQEVDIDSKRSHYNNQHEQITSILPDYNSAFAYNYKVAYIPPPALLRESFGKVDAGLSIFSKYELSEAERVSLPGSYKWPRSILFLDRCMLVTRIKQSNGKKLTLINTHNSAYDQGGFIKKEQLEFIREYALSEYLAGNYVIIGGDWNSYMPGSNGDTFNTVEQPSVYHQGLSDNWTIDGWNWGIDITTPTNRSLVSVYEKGINFECVIDGFLLSPNIEVKSVKNYDLGFQNSDHNPVEITVILK